MFLPAILLRDQATMGNETILRKNYHSCYTFHKNKDNSPFLTLPCWVTEYYIILKCCGY